MAPRVPRRPSAPRPRRSTIPRPPLAATLRPPPPSSPKPAPRVEHRLSEEEEEQASLLDLVDSLLNQGVVLNGDLMIGVAGVDLVYLRLSALLAAADRVLPQSAENNKGKRRRHRAGPSDERSLLPAGVAAALGRR